MTPEALLSVFLPEKRSVSTSPASGDEKDMQVPWLVSNETGNMLGALASSRTGLIKCDEEPLLAGWQIQMNRSPTGHWIFPLAQAFVDLATPWGADLPESMAVLDPGPERPYARQSSVEWTNPPGESQLLASSANAASFPDVRNENDGRE